MLQLNLCDETETFALGSRCGSLLQSLPKKQLVIGLTGTLGAGKTTFTKGLAQALAVEEPVCSPTFTMLNEYDSGVVPLYHFDLYRISEGISPGLIDELSLEIAELLSGEGVFVVEWVDLHAELLAGVEDLRLHFCYCDDGSRQVTITELGHKSLLQKISDLTTPGEEKSSTL
jgi:tRNA threonylcarbamoyladenosine biosynthesis protein TsaE